MKHLDVVIVGAGFSGLYLMHRCLKANRTAVVLEQGSDVGGTWYWNRYPGARCDAESLAYSFSFSSELEQEWTWSERYAPQAEILDYARHVAERFGIRPHIRFNTRVTGAEWNGDDSRWIVTTEQERATPGAIASWQRAACPFPSFLKSKVWIRLRECVIRRVAGRTSL